MDRDLAVPDPEDDLEVQAACDGGAGRRPQRQVDQAGQRHRPPPPAGRQGERAHAHRRLREDLHGARSRAQEAHHEDPRQGRHGDGQGEYCALSIKNYLSSQVFLSIFCTYWLLLN